MNQRNIFFAIVILLVVSAAWITESVFSFSVPIHRDITKESLRTFSVNIRGRNHVFSERALEQIATANGATDNLSSAALFRPERHFTNEAFKDGSTGLINRKSQIIQNLTASPPKGDAARVELGIALHAIQDYYSHTNWVEGNNFFINFSLGRNILSNPSSLIACPSNPNILGPYLGVTSGYFLSVLGCESPPPGKCIHGNYYTCKGINKDKPDQGGTGEHDRARMLASDATKDYVNQIISDISGNENALRALLGLRSIGFVIDDTGSMGEEISGVKEVVRKIVNESISSPENPPTEFLLQRFGDPVVGATFITESPAELLSAVNAIIVSGGGDCPELANTALLKAINAASESSILYFFSDAGSKDRQLLTSVFSRAREKSIYINFGLTGSCSPIAGTSTGSADEANTRGGDVASMSGIDVASISGIDEAYIRSAEETGGQLFFVNSTEVTKLYDLIEPELKGGSTTVFSSKGTLSTTSTSFDTPVDSTMTSLVISALISSKGSITLRRPSGIAVSPSDPDARFAVLASGCIITVANPTTGIWKIEISGAGNYSVNARGVSTIDFFRFDFVEANTDMHGGYFPITGLPITGSDSTVEATILGEIQTANFKLVNESGSYIQNINLSKNFPNAATDHFLGKLTLPAEPFRIVVVGSDKNGLPFQRQYPTLFRSQSLSVETTSNTDDTVRAGMPRTFKFTVKNLGTNVTCNINASTNIGTITRLSQNLVTLGSGESVLLEIDLFIPGSTPINSNILVTITATKSTDSTVYNSATIPFTVVAASADLSISNTASPSPVTVGSSITYTIQVNNNGPDVATNVVVNDDLPNSITFISCTSTNNGVCSGSGNNRTISISSIAPGTSTTITLAANLTSSATVSSSISNTVTVSSQVYDPIIANNSASVKTLVIANVGPGMPIPTESSISSQKAGSVLIYNIYTSSVNTDRQNTLITLTNINPIAQIYVHLFFIDGLSCSMADRYVSLTPNQTISFLASDLDPEITGYLIAVATDQQGCPVNFNYLIGSEYVKFETGHRASLQPLAVAAIDITDCNPSSPTASLVFDGLSYNRLPRSLALDSLFPLAVDGSTMMIINRLGGNLISATRLEGEYFGMLFDDMEHSSSFTLSSNSCQLRGVISANLPRTIPRYNVLIPAGRSGWMKLWTNSDEGVSGSMITVHTSNSSFNNGHNLHILSLTNSVTYTIPVFPVR